MIEAIQAIIGMIVGAVIRGALVALLIRFLFWLVNGY
jgi:hypothetical protein